MALLCHCPVSVSVVDVGHWQCKGMEDSGTHVYILYGTINDVINASREDGLIHIKVVHSGVVIFKKECTSITVLSPCNRLAQNGIHQFGEIRFTDLPSCE